MVFVLAIAATKLFGTTGYVTSVYFIAVGLTPGIKLASLRALV